MPSTTEARARTTHGPTIFFPRTTGVVNMNESSQNVPVVAQSATFKKAKTSLEDLGSQTMEGLLVNGVRETHMIPAGEIGNATPIKVVTEVWSSPELKTAIYSKLSDPRTGDHIFQLTGIVRAEPDPSLFTVPSDFEIVDVPQPMSLNENE